MLVALSCYPQKAHSTDYQTSGNILVLPGGYLYKVNPIKTKIQPNKYEGQCVAWVKKRTGFPYNVGIAKNILDIAEQNNIPVNLTPKIGAIVMIDTPNYAGHIAVVEMIAGDKIRISESNYIASNMYSERFISTNIIGYIHYE